MNLKKMTFNICVLVFLSIFYDENNYIKHNKLILSICHQNYMLDRRIRGIAVTHCIFDFKNSGITICATQSNQFF